MPTSFPDIFFVMDPAYPPPVGTSLTAETFTVTDQNDNGQISRSGGDSIDGQDIRRAYPGDTVTVELPGGSQITYTGVTFYLQDGREVFTPTDGQTVQDSTLVSTTWVTAQGSVTPEELESIPCFTPGTLIEAPEGLRAVELMQVGDLVMTQDHGPQPIRWIGRRLVPAAGDLAPIRFMPGAIGNSRELAVSPQHRMLLTGWRAELHFGEDEILVAAKHLVNGDTIHRAPKRDVEYIHLLFDRHEIIFAEGVATESFYPGDCVLGNDPEARAEILSIFPELEPADECDWPTARKVLKKFEATVCV